MIAAIAPRAVIVNSKNNDYSDNAEGDAIGVEGAKKVGNYGNVAFGQATGAREARILQVGAKLAF